MDNVQYGPDLLYVHFGLDRINLVVSSVSAMPDVAFNVVSRQDSRRRRLTSLPVAALCNSFVAVCVGDTDCSSGKRGPRFWRQTRESSLQAAR